MKKRNIWITMGVSLILMSLCFVIVFQAVMKNSSAKSQKMAQKLSALIPERTPGLVDDYRDTAMPVVEIDGVDYVALLEIPAFGMKAPVADAWEGKILTTAVGRFWGSAYDRSLVIGGPDYPGMFDFCDDIETGTRITVTDMTGAQFTYTVSRIDRAGHAKAQWLTDAESDLTLFNCDMDSMEYIAVRCALDNNKNHPAQ